MKSDFPVYVFEEHSSTLPIWWKMRRDPRTVVYLDAHLDLQKIEQQKIDQLESCNRQQEFEKFEIENPVNNENYGIYGIENFLYPASQLNLVNRLVWVVPPHVPRSYTPSLIEYLEQMDGVTFEEITSFRQAGDHSVRGTLLGLDITLCHFSDLDDLSVADDYDLDIDIDYFVRVPEDTLWADPKEVITSVLDTLGSPRVATVSRAVGSGFTPLKHRFIADYVQAILNRDDQIRDYYSLVFDATLALESNNKIESLRLCDSAVKHRPDIASAYFTKALATDDPAAKADLVDKTQQLDRLYRPTLAQRALGVAARKQKINRSQSLEVIKRLEAMPEIDPKLPGTEVAVAQLLADNGQIGKAWSLLQKRSRDMLKHGNLLLEIGTRLATTEQVENAWRVLDMARQSDTTRTAASYQLGLMAERAGKLTTALKFYGEVHQRAPAWLLPVKKIIACLHKLQRQADAAPVEKELSKRQDILSELIQA